MKLHAAMIWYNEPAAWLANTITSLTRAGVDHLVVVDGAFQLYPNALPRSGFEQAEIIQRTCDGLGIALTMHQPSHPWIGNELEKRTAAFRLLNAIATPEQDWVLIIDADEVITTANPDRLRDQLANADGDCGTVRMWWREDWTTDPISHELAVKMPQPTEGYQRQSRWFRVLDNMRVEQVHYAYFGDRNGDTIGLRADYPEPIRCAGATPARMFKVDSNMLIEHLDRLRPMQRASAKRDYYDRRDEACIERLA